jgi:hypothetical protein
VSTAAIIQTGLYGITCGMLARMNPPCMILVNDRWLRASADAGPGFFLQSHTDDHFLDLAAQVGQECYNVLYNTLMESDVSDENGSVVGMSPPPRKEDVLFGPGKDSNRNACIAQWDADWAYSTGFRRAAIRLAEDVCDTATNQDTLIYPIVYLYRHHVELVLKAIITSASGLLDRELTEQDLKALGRHGLWELWQIARPLLDPVCDRADNPPFPVADLDGVDSYIRQIHAHDPDGQRFRYATTKAKGISRSGFRPSLSPQLKLVNIRIFAVAMEKLSDYLEGIEGWFVGLEDAKAEVRRVYGS